MRITKWVYVCLFSDTIFHLLFHLFYYRCPVDPSIFPSFTPDGNALQSVYEAFRFTESYGVIFQCNVKYCLGPCEPVRTEQDILQNYMISFLSGQIYLNKFLNSISGGLWMGPRVCGVLGQKEEICGFQPDLKWIWRWYDSEPRNTGPGLRRWEEQWLFKKWNLIFWLRKR